MEIESRSIVGGAAALAVVGVACWLSITLFSGSSNSGGSVEVQQIAEPSWAVEVKQIDQAEARTASR